MGNYFSSEDSARQPHTAGECDDISLSVSLCIRVCVCVVCMRVFVHTESIIIIHSSYVL